MIEVIDCPGALPRQPRPSQLTRWFWDGLAEGRLATTCCSNCGRLSFPPRADCPDCWSNAWSWRDLSGRGVLYSRTRVAVAPEAFASRLPLEVGVADLEEGLRLVCWLVEGAESLSLDAPVQLAALRFHNGCLLGAKPG